MALSPAVIALLLAVALPPAVGTTHRRLPGAEGLVRVIGAVGGGDPQGLPRLWKQLLGLEPPEWQPLCPAWAALHPTDRPNGMDRRRAEESNGCTWRCDAEALPLAPPCSTGPQPEHWLGDAASIPEQSLPPAASSSGRRGVRGVINPMRPCAPVTMPACALRPPKGVHCDEGTCGVPPFPVDVGATDSVKVPTGFLLSTVQVELPVGTGCGGFTTGCPCPDGVGFTATAPVDLGPAASGCLDCVRTGCTVAEEPAA
mmetsp:Transcript_124634/g.248739  ORF Transcript_124634/g.248739 Transcript_124634/m.248739 type:complete len:257 (+) Transcript_124634:2163-2933(+)